MSKFKFGDKVTWKVSENNFKNVVVTKVWRNHIEIAYEQDGDTGFWVTDVSRIRKGWRSGK